MIDTHPNVAVFWDFESCPASTSGYAIVDNVRSLALRFGVIKSFRAYLAVYNQQYATAGGHPRALALRSELQSSGVSLTDVPYGKDAIGKTLLVDMLAYAFDHMPTKVVLVVITADHLLAYALSVLRMRNYRVVLLTSDTAACSALTSQVTVCFDWKGNEGECHDAPRPRPTSPRKERAGGSEETGERLASEYGAASLRSGPTARPSLSDDTASTSIVASSPLTFAKELDAAEGEEIPPSSPGSEERDLTSSISLSDAEREEELQSALSQSTQEIEKSAGMGVDVAEDDAPITTSSSALPSSASTSSHPTVAASILPLPRAPPAQDPSGKKPPANAARQRHPPPNFALRSEHSAARPSLIPTAQPPTILSAHAAPVSSPSQFPTSPPVTLEVPPRPIVSPSPSSSSNALPTGDTPPSSTQGPSKASSSEASTSAQERAIPVQFEVLVRIMEEYRQRGVKSVGRSFLSADLPKRQPDIYAQAMIHGVARPFKRYIDSAIECGILLRDSAECVSLAEVDIRPPSTTATPEAAVPRTYKLKDLPLHFKVLFDVMVELRRLRGNIINCDYLGINGFEKPLEEYIVIAIYLGILVRDGKAGVSLLMPEIPPQFVPLAAR